MIDYKKLANNSEDAAPELDHPRKHHQRTQDSTESAEKIARTINTFYHDKEAYEEFVRAVGKDTALRWMAMFIQRSQKE